ncbi:MAG: cell division protein ZapE [Hyphomicrobiaceae bacterium]|nr:cell division protein ZapE [Hyphomicrobiaceae bacterium]
MLKLYETFVTSGDLQHSGAQRAVAERLDTLVAQIEHWQNSKSYLRKLLGKVQPAPKGLYIHGSVGRGKTMLMDMFYEAVCLKHKHRSHFHEFMADVHDRIGKARKITEGDPMPRVAKQLVAHYKLLCFDELHVTDIADAMILGRLFKFLFEADMVVVTTSNFQPTELYKNGLNRQLFLPFIHLIGSKMETLKLDSDKDFRTEKFASRRTYFSPLNHITKANMDRTWTNIANGAIVKQRTLEVKGRKIEVMKTARGGARFNFDELCSRPLGAVDYLALAEAFHTIMMDSIPILTPDRRNEARRFINLIDTLYNNNICFIASAEAEPDKIYLSGHGVELFERTASRLMEMRSEDYLSASFHRSVIDKR